MNLTPDDLRIRQALEQIETPMYDIAGAVREQRARRSRRIPLRRSHRLLAALVAALLLTATAAAAVQLSGSWRALFGQGVIVPTELTTPVYQTKTVGDCTVTLEDAIVTDGSVAVIYSLRYADASALHTDSYTTLLGATSLLLDGTEDACVSSSGTGTFDSEQPGVEYFYDAFTLSEDPGDQPLTLEIGPASRLDHPDAVDASIDLAAIYASHPVTHQAEDTGAQRLAALRQQDCSSAVLPQSAESPDIRFAGVALENDALCLALVMPTYDRFDGESAQIASLRDSRDGRMYYGSTHIYGDTGSDLELCESSFSGLSIEDLPYLEPQIAYRRSTPLTDKGWTFTFSAPSVKTLTQSLSLSCKSGLQLDQLTVSPLGIELTGTQTAAAADSDTSDSLEGPTVTLLLEDGTAVQTEAHSWSRSYGETDDAPVEISIEYEYRADAHSRRFLPTESVTAVRIDQKTIPIAE